MSKKSAKEMEISNKTKDILGLIPSALYQKLHEAGYYMLIPSDAFPFCIRAIHKRGFEAVLEANTEEELVAEAYKALDVFNGVNKEGLPKLSG
jgi:hypothetical protein